MAFYRFRPVLTAFWHADGLPFADVLSEGTIQQACAAAGLPTPVDDPNDPTVYTPALTLWAFLSHIKGAIVALQWSAGMHGFERAKHIRDAETAQFVADGAVTAA